MKAALEVKCFNFFARLDPGQLNEHTAESWEYQHWETLI